MGAISREIKIITATIPASAATSSGVFFGGYALAGLLVPVLTSANLGLAVNYTGGAIIPIYDKAGNALAIATPAGTGGVAIGSDSLPALAGYNEIVYISAATAQSAARNFVWHFKG